MTSKPTHGDVSRHFRRSTPRFLTAATLGCLLSLVISAQAADPAPKKSTKPPALSPNAKAAAKVAADRAAKKAATSPTVIVPGAKAVWPTSKPKTKTAKESKAKWPTVPKDPNDNDGIIAIEGGIVGPDGSVTIGGSPDAPTPKVLPKVAVASPSPSLSASAPVQAGTEPPTLEGSGEASADGEVALDLGADVENSFNPYVFDRGPGWVFMPAFALIILGLHLIPVPKRKMKKLIAQTGLFKGLPGKEETKTDTRVNITVERVAVSPPGEKPLVAAPVNTGPQKRRFSSSGSMIAATGEIAPPKQTPPSEAPTRLAVKRPPTPAPVNSIARELEKDEEDERTRLYVKRGGRHGDEEEES